MSTIWQLRQSRELALPTRTVSQTVSSLRCIWYVIGASEGFASREEMWNPFSQTAYPKPSWHPFFGSSPIANWEPSFPNVVEPGEDDVHLVAFPASP